MKNQTNSTVQAAANLATVQREQVNALNPHAHEICIKPAADSLAGLPKVDIFRDSLAAWMKSDQPKLTQEVGEVVVELNTQGSEQDALTEQTELLVSLDGGQTFSPAPNGVRIIYKNVFVPGEDEPGELHMNATSEGVISDLWVSREEHLDHNLGTSSALVDDILERLVDDSVLESDNAEEEILPGAVASEVREIMMQDIVGESTSIS